MQRNYLINKLYNSIIVINIREFKLYLATQALDR
jgi:hypothetical protein